MEYKVLSNVQHDGTFYPHGSTIDVGGQTANSLLEQGVIEKLDKAESEPPKEDDPPKRIVPLDEAFEMLLNDVRNGSVSEEDAFTKSGKPDCAMLAKYAKRDINGKERNAWWSKHSANPDNDTDPGDTDPPANQDN